MAEEPQPANIVEGASTTAELEDEVNESSKAKSAEDRKAAAALSNLDVHRDDDSASSNAKHVDAEAVSRAMDRLSGANGAGGAGKGGVGGGAAVGGEKKEVKKVKIDAEDLALVMDELELSKVKATELLKAHDGDAVKAMRAYIQPPLKTVKRRW